MADISMCIGDGCTRKFKCYRHTAPVNEYRQSYFVVPPVDKAGKCEYFWQNFGDRPMLFIYDLGVNITFMIRYPNGYCEYCFKDGWVESAYSFAPLTCLASSDSSLIFVEEL